MEAGKWLALHEKVSLIVHLGDDSDDAKVLKDLNIELIVVPGVFEPYYLDPQIPNRIIKYFKGKKVLISHTEETHKNDFSAGSKELLRPEEIIAKKEVDIALVGHTHIPKIEEKEGLIVLNPGHLKDWDEKKGYFPSFGLLDLEKNLATIINLEGKVPIIQKKLCLKR